MSGRSVRREWSRRRASAVAAVGWALLIGGPRLAPAATYYVDITNPACSAGGPGSQAAPYCTISAAVTQHPGAGNTILVVAGTYREQVSIPASGASGSPFVIQAASPAVTVDGADDFSSPAQWSQLSGGVWLASGVTWAPKQVFAGSTRLTATTVPPASMGAGTFQYVAGAGLYVNGGGGNPAGYGMAVGRRLYGFTMSGKSWVTIRGFTVTRAEDKGILVQSGSSQCEVSDDRVAFSFKYGIQIVGSTGCLVARNVSADNGGHGIALTGGATGCTVEDNESCRNADPLVRVANGLYLFGAPSNVIQRNRYHHNQDSGQHLQSSSSSCLSIQNRSWSNGDHGFDHLGSTGTLHVGDVAWGNNMDGFSIEGGATGTRLFDCIATDNGLTTDEFDLWVESSSLSGFVSDYNLFWNSTAQPPVKHLDTAYTSLVDYAAASGQDAQTIQADPRFTNPAAGDFRLLAGSPAIDNANSGVPSFPAADARGLARMDDPATADAGAGPVLFADRGALEFPPARLTLSPPSGPAPLLVTADATGSRGPDGTVASYRFDFGDGTIVGPQPGPTATHAYSPGQWTATVTVIDQGGGTGTATASVNVTAPGVTALDRRVAASSDDAEEKPGAKPLLTGTSLDLVYESTNQTVGMRWTALNIPPHAIIRSAFIQFTSRASRTEATSLTFRGQASDNSPTFTTAIGNVSSRPRTVAQVSWAPASWSNGQAGPGQRTPDLSAVIDEIVNRPGWASGNALAIIVTGSGRRDAYSYDGSAAAAPLLHVEYSPDFPPVAGLSVRQLATPALTVTADGSTSTDADAAPIASYRFTFGDGTPAVTTAAPTATAQHTYAAAGNYTVTLIATDTRGLASAPVTTSVTVNGAPTARLSVTQVPSPPLTVTANASASTDPDPMPIASYRFDFGDGTPVVTATAPTATAQHTYAAAGTYTVRVTVTDSGGLAATATAAVTLDAAPIARLAVTQAASPPLTMNANASASTDTDGTPIVSFRFNFGDGTPAVTTTAPTATAQHTYAAAGAYTVTLTAADAGGFISAPATASVTVNGAPTARLSVAQALSPPLTVTANASASTDPDPMPIASFRFDFGDGSPAVTTTAPTATAQHAYAAAGTYTVRVTATDTGGLASSPATASVTLDAAPIARLAAVQAASPALTVNADASASTDTDATPIASFRFDFGDSTPAVTTTAPTASAQHTYAAAGVYTLTLIATDGGGYASAPATASVTVNGAPTARLFVTTTPSPPLTVTADASASTDPDPMPIASYRFNFGDGTPAVTTTAPTATAQHTYAAAGTYTVTLVATDAGGLASAPATAPATVAPTGVDRRIAAGSDDAEEPTGAKPVTSGNDLELVFDTSIQTVGMRWTGITTPPRATITKAYIQFAAKESQSEATSLTIRGQAADNAPTFTTATGNISTRPRTSAATTWAPVPWTTGEAGANQRTPDLKAVIQEIVNRSGWVSGNALAIIVTGTGHRTAWSYNGNAALAPLLHVEFTPPDSPPTARVTATQAPSPALTVIADGSASTDTDATPIATYRFTFGDGSPPVTTTAPSASAQHAYAAAGTYTVTLIATDSGGFASTPATTSIAVSAPDYPPVAALALTQAASPPLTAIADASASTDTDATPIASFRFDFGDGTPAVTTTPPVASAQHTYAAPGTYTVSLIATDSGGNASAPASASITLAAPATLEQRIAAWIDDIEEAASGTIYVNSGDLEMTTDGSVVQTVGMRWPGLAIPKGATVTTAWIQFAAKESHTVATNLTFQAEASDNAPSFGSSAFNVTTRPRTTAATSWSPVSWVAGEAGANQRTPDLGAVIQAIVSRPGWASGNAIAFIVSGTGHRTAWSYDGSSAAAPLLHVEYTAGSGGAMAGRAGLAHGPEASAVLEAPGVAVAASAPAPLPTHLALSSARPNPASGPISFRLELPERNPVRWGIYDLQGRALWSEERMVEAGSIDLTWNGRTADGSHAAPGLYFARVHADNRVLIRRFVRL